MNSAQPKPLRIGVRNTLSRAEAIEEYVILRLRAEDIKRLDFLVNAFYRNRMGIPADSPFSAGDFKDPLRTAFLGWFASLIDRDEKAVYAFDCLLLLFPERQGQIIKVQLELEAIHAELQQFRSNVAFHARCEVSAHIDARKKLQDENTYLDLVSAIPDFQALMTMLILEENQAIPELQEALERLGLKHHPAFRVSQSGEEPVDH